MPQRIVPKRQVQLHLAAWREHRGLTQQQLADRVGSTGVTISRWETRQRQPDLAAQEAIAEALDIDVADLRRHPDQPSADALLRDQPQEIIDLALRVIAAITATGDERHPDDDWLTKFFHHGRSADEVERMKKTLEAAFPPKPKRD
jgi:transcriptional regulator with XRE-family HTH domain